MEREPLISIHCLVYNHQHFLRHCLDGIVMQQTDYPYEVIVHDDASTDGSAAVIREYAEKYSGIGEDFLSRAYKWVAARTMLASFGMKYWMFKYLDE